MNLTIYFAFLIFFGFGLLLGWLFFSKRIAEARSAGAVSTAQVDEIRNQLNSAVADLEKVRRELASEQAHRARAETESRKERENLEEQKRLLFESENKLREAFNALASGVLQKNNEQFLQLAEQKFTNLHQQSTSDLARRQESIKGLVDPLQQRLTDLQSHLGRLESNREEAYGALKSQVEGLAQSNRDLQKETGSLVSTLRQPQVRGRWGELTLKRAVELAGMSPHCDFQEQVSVDTAEGRLRPDLIVRLPGNARVVVDAKVPLHGFLKVAEAQNDAEREAGLIEHARLVRQHVNQLSSKEYWKQFEPSPDFVVLFVPGESFYSAALEKDPNLLEDAISSHVVLASPGNLIAILRAVAYGWRQEKVAESAHQINELGRELYDRLATFLGHIGDIRSGLERANKSFNSAVGSLEGRVLPAARKLKEKGIQSSSDLKEIEPTETALRLSNSESQENSD